MKNIKINNAGETGMNRNTGVPTMKKTDISSSMHSFNRIRVGTAAVITAFATMALTAQAAIVVDAVNDASATAYSANVSSVDLLHGLSLESQTGTWMLVERPCSMMATMVGQSMVDPQPGHVRHHLLLLVSPMIWAWEVVWDGV